MYLLGYELGSSSVRASLVEVQSGERLATTTSSGAGMEIRSLLSGWAEQEPESWWENLRQATAELLRTSGVQGSEVAAIGISYPMHGLVLVDKNGEALRPCILGSDLRGASYGMKACQELGEEWCLTHLLNVPENCAATRLAWVKEHEPELYARIHKVLLPGDFLTLKLTGASSTTLPGLSEGLFWDFRKGRLADVLFKHFGFSDTFVPTILPTFSVQGEISETAAEQLGLKTGTPVSYKAGEHLSNALALGVLNPGEFASTAGESGGIYGVTGRLAFDAMSRVNCLAHVNHTAGIPGKRTVGPELVRIGVLHRMDGVSNLDAWMKEQLAPELNYEEMEALASRSPIGAKGLSMTFGNEAEGCSLHGLRFQTHIRADVLRAARESAAFCYAYGLEAMESLGLKGKRIRAGKTGLYVSPVFRETLAGVTGTAIELYEVDDSVAAAKAAGVGAGIYPGVEEAFASLDPLDITEPDPKDRRDYLATYERWKLFRP